MALIDATARFAARREAARDKGTGRFGDQEHTAPEIGLLIDNNPPQTLEDIFEEMNELGDLDDTLTTPEKDTYTGSQEQRDHDRRVRELNTLLADAGIDRETLSEATLADIQDGMLHEEDQRQRQAEYRARRDALEALEASENALPEPRTEEGRAVRAAVISIIEARGYELSSYSHDGIEYMERWAREQAIAGNLDAAVAEEVARSAADRAENERIDRENQIAHNGPLTDAVWDEALEEGKLRAQQRVRRYRPTTRVSLKETNQLIRHDLKDAFGKQKFSVTGNSYSGGSSVNVNYIDGPPENEVRDIVGRFTGSTFDGMTDSTTYHDNAEFDADGVPVSVHYQPNHVFTRRDFSDEVKQEAQAFLIKAYADEGEAFDPTSRGRYLTPPQALYNRVGEAERESGYFNYRLRGGEQSVVEMETIAAALIADERWAKSQK